MFWCGCILIFTLPIIGSTKIFYAINSLRSPNLTCYRENHQLQPCGSLDILPSKVYSQNISKIYLLDSRFEISNNIHLNFSSHYNVEMKPWRSNSFSTLVCNSDFSMTFNGGTKGVTIQSIQFKGCGKLNALILIKSNEWPVMFVQIINVNFIRSGQSSLQIVGDIHELRVTNSTFIGGRKDVDINTTGGTVLKAMFRSTTFSHSRMGSLITRGSLNESSLYIQNCTFSNMVVTDYIARIQLYSFHSIVIESSSFEEIFANNFIRVESVINMSIFDSCFHSNVVQNGSILHLISSQSNASLFFVDNIVSNNSAKLSHKGILSINGLQTFIRNCIFQGNSVNGSGSTLTITGNHLTVINVTIFEENVASSEGGAVLGRAIKSFYVYRCNFTNNSADSGGALSISGEAIVIQNSYFNSNIAEEHGGALQINAGMVNITGSHWFNNTALIGNGGAISITSDLDAASLELHSCNFNWNKANFLGGAVSLLSLVTFTSFKTNFTTNYASAGGAIIVTGPYIAILWNSLFYNNTSEWTGGALYVMKRGTKIILIADCVFESNFAAASGGAIVFEAIDSFSVLPYCCRNIFDRVDDIIDEIVHHDLSSKLLLPIKSDYCNLTVTVNGTFAHNSAKKGGGAISVLGKYTDDRLVFIDCALIGNSAPVGGGMFFTSSNVFLRNALFYYNRAQYFGGGIHLEKSKICFTGNVSFIANKVSHEEGQGGAIFSNDSREACVENLCPILWTNQSNLSFNDNFAEEGPAIFGGMLDRCNRLPEGSLETAFRRLEFDNRAYDQDSFAITSLGNKICFNISCEIRKVKKSIFPGQSIVVNISCVDQLEQPVSNCNVKYSINFGIYDITIEEMVISGFQPILYKSYPDTLNSTSLKVSGDLVCNESIWNEIEVFVDHLPCPLGFYNTESLECICDRRLQSIFRNVECDINNEAILISSGWFSYRNRLLRIHNKCPFNYCQKLRNFISPLEPDNQCGHNRGGVLCGGCLANYSVVLGSWKCMNCSHTSGYNFIWLTVVMALAGVVLVTFLLLMKMTVSIGTINGLIFYANVMSSSGLLDHQNCAIHPFLHVFISWINLDLGIDVCFYSGMDVYQKTWLQFVFPFYIWFLVGVIILVCHYSSKVMKLLGMRNIEVLATLFLLSYAKLLKTIVTALSVTNIMVASADNITDPLRPHKVWVYDGNLDYFGSKHLPLFIVSVLFLFTLFMPYTLFLLCGQLLQYIPRRRGFQWTHSIFISTIMDAYHAPYTKHHRYWIGLGLLIRCCLFTIFGTCNNARIILMSITTVVILLLVISRVSSGILYRNKVVSLLELFYLSNLGILATVLLVNDALCAAITASISLSFVVFVGTFFYHLHQETKIMKNSYKRMRNKIYETIITKITKTGTIDEEDKIMSPEQGASSSYFELRESLIDSTV